ncbi:MAG: hypothetical protein ACRD6W_00640 [Nitrososphaerales archaeon]
MLKKKIATLALGGTLLAGVGTLGTYGAAYASTPSATASAKTTTSAKSWLRAHRRQLERAAIKVSAKTIGVTPQDLVSELRSGKSVAEVAGEHNVSATTVVNALVSAADTKISQAFSAHKLSATEAQKIETALPARVNKLVNRVF